MVVSSSLNQAPITSENKKIFLSSLRNFQKQETQKFKIEKKLKSAAAPKPKKQKQEEESDCCSSMVSSSCGGSPCSLGRNEQIIEEEEENTCSEKSPKKNFSQASQMLISKLGVSCRNEKSASDSFKTDSSYEEEDSFLRLKNIGKNEDLKDVAQPPKISR